MHDDDLTPALLFTRDRTAADKIALSVTHDRAKSIFGCSGRDSTQLEMLGEFWARVIPALVVLMTDVERAECLKGIAERLGVEFTDLDPTPLGLQVYQGGTVEPVAAG